jgi:hypothetical protein
VREDRRAEELQRLPLGRLPIPIRRTRRQLADRLELAELTASVVAHLRLPLHAR